MSLPAAYLAEVQSRGRRLVAWVEIEGLPWGFSTVELGSSWTARWGAGAGSATGPKGTSASMRMPSPIDITLDPLRGISNIGQTQIQAIDKNNVLLEASAVHRTADVVRLSAALTPTSTADIVYEGTASLTAYPAGGGVLYVDGETIKYTAHNDGTKTFSGITRGWYRSRPASHLSKRPITPYPRHLAHRRCWLYYSRHPDAIADRDTDSLAYDHSANVKHGKIISLTKVASPWSAFGDAYDFNGTTGYIDVGPSGTGLSGAFTVEGRIKPDDVGFRKVLGRYGATVAEQNYVFGISASSKLFLQVIDGGGTFRVANGTTTLVAGTSYVVAGTYDGTNLRVFLNGTLEGTTACANLQAPDAVTPLMIGRTTQTGTAFFDGVIDEVRISNIARYTATYTPATARFSSDANTVALWHFDGPQSDEVLRLSGIVTDAQMVNDLSAWRITLESTMRALERRMFSWQVSGECRANDAGDDDTAYAKSGRSTNVPGTNIVGFPALRVNPEFSRALQRRGLTAAQGSEEPHKWVLAKSAYDNTSDADVSKRQEGMVLLKTGDEEDAVYWLCPVPIPSEPMVPVLRAFKRGPHGLTRLQIPHERRADGVYYGPPLYEPHPSGGAEIREVWDVGLVAQSDWGGSNLTPSKATRVTPQRDMPTQPRTFWPYHSTNPMEMLLAHLLSGEVGDYEGDDYKWWGIDATGYGVNDAWANLTTDDVDVAAIQAIRDEIPGAFVATTIEEPTSLLDFIVDQLIRPWGLVFVHNAEGKLTVKRAGLQRGATSAGLPVIDESFLDQPPEWSGNVRQSYDGLVIRDRRTGDVLHKETFIDQVLQYGNAAETIEIETDNHAFSPGSDACIALGATYSYRFGVPSPIIRVVSDFAKYDVDVGDAVALSCANLPSTVNATYGVTGLICYVIGKRIDDAAGRIEFTLESGVAEATSRYGLIGPAAQATAYNEVGGTREFTISVNFYSAVPHNDLEEFEVGMRVAVWDKTFTTQHISNGRVTAISLGVPNKITVDPQGSQTSTPAADAIVILSDYRFADEADSPALTTEQNSYVTMASSGADLDTVGTTASDTVPYAYAGSS